MNSKYLRNRTGRGLRHRVKLGFLAALFCFHAAALPPLLGAGEPKEEDESIIRHVTPEGRVVIGDCNLFHVFAVEDYWILLLHGNVHIACEKTRIWADSVVLWYDYTETEQLYQILRDKKFRYGYQVGGALEDGGLGLPYSYKRAPPDLPSGEGLSSPWTERPLEFYAEGNVRVSHEEGEFFCDQLYTNLREKRGLILHGEAFSKADIRNRTHPLHFRFAAIKQVCERLYTMENASLSTCVCGMPHFDLRVERAELRGEPREGLLTIEGISFRVRGVSLPLPDSSFQIGRNWYFPIKRVSAGSSSRFGTYLEVTLVENFDRLGSSVQSALGLDAPFRGDVSLEVDLYNKRGVGLGPEIDYESKGLYKGYLKGYYINDGSDEDRGGWPVEENKRGRVRTQNRIHLEGGSLLDLEMSYITDRRFLDEYFENEYKTDKEQETYLYFHEAQDSHAYSLLTRFRLNDFQTQNEYFPQAIWDVSSVPVFGLLRRDHSAGSLVEPQGLFYSHRTEFSQVRNRPDDDLPDDSERLTRGDYLGLLEAPFRVSALKVTPFYENRLSYFERTDGNSNPVGRVAETFGVRSGLLFHGRSDFESDFLNIHGIRNIMEPAVVYRNTFALNREQEKLIPFDDMEQVTRGEVVAVNFRQRLQTRDMEEEEEERIHTFYDGFWSLPFYPDRRLGMNDHRMGNLRFDQWFLPLFKQRLLKNLSLNEEGEFNLTHKRLESLNSRLHLNPDDDLSFMVRHRWIRNQYNYLGWAARYLLTPKWELEAGIRYNLVRRTWDDRMLILRRRAHQWLLEFTVEVDKGDNNKSFSIGITPLALFGSQHRGSIYDPMVGE